VNLIASTTTAAENVGDLFTSWIASIAANLIAPLFDAGLRSAEVDRTQAVTSQRLHEYGQTILTALAEVEDALVQEREQRRFIDSLETQFTLAGQVVERIRQRYTLGAVDYLDVLDALLTYQTLQRNRLTARRQLIEFRIGLYRALAGGWTMATPNMTGRAGSGVLTPSPPWGRGLG
jgi:outer membrane protein TolC